MALLTGAATTSLSMIIYDRFWDNWKPGLADQRGRLTQ